MSRRKDYIESPKHWKDMYNNPSFKRVWETIDKVPLDSIKVDKSLFSYPNDVDQSQVLGMIVEFDRELWIPVLVNRNFYLLDGQHRLAAARQLCLKYIDVIVQTDDARRPN